MSCYCIGHGIYTDCEGVISMYNVIGTCETCYVAHSYREIRKDYIKHYYPGLFDVLLQLNRLGLQNVIPNVKKYLAIPWD